MDSTPHSCSYCTQLVIDLRPAIFGQSSGSNEDIAFYLTLADLHEAANRGCNLCRWILNDECIFSATDIFQGVTHEQARNANTLSQLVSKLSGPFGEKTLTDLALVGYTSVGRDRFDVLTIKNFGLHSRRHDKLLFLTATSLTVYADYGDPAARFVSTRPIAAEVSSSRSYHLAQTWMKECFETHGKCARPTGSFIPKRLIEIVESGQQWRLRLRLNEKENSEYQPYAALSYCWGGDQPVKSTKDTLNGWLVGLPWESLPMSLRDAATVTRELNIRFFWVDALCIIQDDVEDLALEISRMPQIFSQASVTIAAARANSASEGFLHDRSELASSGGSAFRVPYLCPDGIFGSLVLCNLGREKKEEPLDSRAWVLQERLLTTRTLEYGSRQLRWICQESEEEEAYTDGWRRYAETSLARGDNMNVARLTSSAPKITALNAVDRILDDWNLLVTAYTRRQLTVKTDRILAISGMAERLGTVFRDQYLAGIWRCTIPLGLLWTLWHPDYRARRPPVYQGPSWSWMSVNGPINPLLASRETSSDLEITDYQLQPTVQAAPYGTVRFGHLELKGRVREAEWNHNVEDDPLRVRGAGGADYKLTVKVWADALEEEFVDKDTKWIPVSLLEVCGRGKNGAAGFLGLVLRDLGNSHFSRLGVVAFNELLLGKKRPDESQQSWERRIGDHENCFSGCERRSITIV